MRLFDVVLKRGRTKKGAERSKDEFCAFSASDARALFTLDRQCLLSPWTFEGFLSELEQPYTYCWGKRDARGIIAFIMVHLILDEAHVLKLGVSPEFRRQGIAHRLLSYSLHKVTASGAVRAYLEVRRSQAGARALYEGLGFRQSGERRDYYGPEEGHQSEREDAILYDLTLG